MMKVYFGAAISKKDLFEAEYVAIQSTIKSLGHELIKAYNPLNEDLDEIMRQTDSDVEEYYKQWVKTVSMADVAVFEATFPSTIHIGTEIGVLIERGKPVICLYRESNPVFMNSFHSTRFIKSMYSLENIEDVLEWTLDEAEQWLHRRFTMNIPSEMDTFLAKTSKLKRTTRSQFIRDLISKEMNNSPS